MKPVLGFHYAAVKVQSIWPPSPVRLSSTISENTVVPKTITTAMGIASAHLAMTNMSARTQMKNVAFTQLDYLLSRQILGRNPCALTCTSCNKFQICECDIVDVKEALRPRALRSITEASDMKHTHHILCSRRMPSQNCFHFMRGAQTNLQSTTLSSTSHALLSLVGVESSSSDDSYSLTAGVNSSSSSSFSNGMLAILANGLAS